MHRALILGVAVCGLYAFACEKDNNKSSTETTAAQPPANTATTPTTTPAEPAPTTKKEPTVAWKGVGLSTPESVLHDGDADVYLVSNVDGEPLSADGKGFISRLTPDGKVDKLKWIESGKEKVTLNAPKGLALHGDLLYVADLDTVRMFDRKSGAPKGEVKIPGATFLNGMAVASDGRILVSDTGMKAAGKGMEPAGNDAVFAIDTEKKVAAVAKSSDLGHPNGLAVGTDKTWVVTFGTGEIYGLDATGKKMDAKKLPKGQLDGILVLPSGDLLVSSWEAGAIYKSAQGSSSFEVLIENTPAPAGIGWDKKRSRVLVPLFNDNEVRAYDVK